MTIWCYVAGEETIGPIDLHTLSRALKTKMRSSDILVWQGAYKDRIEAIAVPALKRFFVRPPPVPSPNPVPYLSPKHRQPRTTKEKKPVARGWNATLLGWAIGFGLARILGGALIALLLSSFSVIASPFFDYDASGPMIFREGFNGGNCNGCEWTIAEGTIQQDTPDVFRKFLEAKKPKPGSSVRFNSPGGNLLAGLKLGEMIRSAGLFTEVGKTIGEQSSFDTDTIQEKVPDSPVFKRPQGICASACVYAFLGGATRFASKSKIGIHQFYDGKALNEPLAKTASAIDRSVDQILTGLLLEYVVRMGVDARLISLASSVAPWEDIKWLSDQEILDLKIDNSETVFTPISVEAFGKFGSYVETVSRSGYYSFRHRVYCKGNARSPYIAFVSGRTDEAAATNLKDSIGQILEHVSIILIGDNGEHVFPIRIAALEMGKDASHIVQASALIVGATMADIQNSNRLALRSDNLPRYLGELAFSLSFNLPGDRRKIGIASRSCLP